MLYPSKKTKAPGNRCSSARIFKQRAKLTRKGEQTASKITTPGYVSYGIFAGASGMLYMDIIAEIRRRHLVSKESISSIARDLKLCRQTVRKHLQTTAEPIYQRQHQPLPKLSEFQTLLESWLNKENYFPKAQRRTARLLFERLQVEGYQGAYDSVQRFVKQWQMQQRGSTVKEAFIPLVFTPGQACQFDWSQEQDVMETTSTEVGNFISFSQEDVHKVFFH